MTIDVRTQIVKASLKLFSTKGFHGTSIRAISAAVKISLPTIYYYFKSKSDLFDEVVTNEFLQLHQRMQREMNISERPEEIYSQGIIAAKRLNDYDKQILGMAMKVAFGFDGTKKAREQILSWEKKRFDDNLTLLSKLGITQSENKTFISLLVDISEHLLHRIILLKEDIPNEEIRKKFVLLFNMREN
jgi:hypothetical protein